METLDSSTPSPSPSSPVAPGRAAASSSCRWPGCKTPPKGSFCKTDSSRLRLLGLSTTEGIARAAELPRLWAERTAARTPPASVEVAVSRRDAPLLAAEVNALPERVRRYVHDLETRCDPTGDVQKIASLTEQRDGLVNRVQEADTEIAKLRERYHSLERVIVGAHSRLDAAGIEPNAALCPRVDMLVADRNQAVAETRAAEERAEKAEAELARLREEKPSEYTPKAGAEAEDLRSALDRVLPDFCDETDRRTVERILDEVDARDSLRFLEEQDDRRERQVKALRDSLAHALGYSGGAGETTDEELLRLNREAIYADDPNVTWKEAASIADDVSKGAMRALERHGHTPHCVGRQAHGDGECECGRGFGETPPIAKLDRERAVAVALCDVIDADNPSVITRAAVRGLRAMVGGAS